MRRVRKGRRSGEGEVLREKEVRKCPRRVREEEGSMDQWLLLPITEMQHKGIHDCLYFAYY